MKRQMNESSSAALALTYGRYVGNIPGSRAGRAWFSVWF